MFIKIHNSVVVSFSKSYIDGGIYTEQENIYGGMIVLSKTASGEKREVVIGKKKVIKKDSKTGEETTEIQNVTEEFDVFELVLEDNPDHTKALDIKAFRVIEKQAVKLRGEYLTAEMLPEGSYKTAKLAKLTESGQAVLEEFSLHEGKIKSRYGEDFLIGLA